MNKKFLSAILFGALMVTSTGTFVSCKDYDDDIENLQGQIDKNSSAIAELQKLVGAGNWVTSISPVTGGFTVTMSNGQSQTITGINGADGKDGKNGTEWTIGEDGFWYMDGEKTDNVAIGKNGENGVTAPSPQIVDGYWVVYNWDAEKGEFVAETTEVPAAGTAAYAVEANGVITLHIADANGEYMEIALPSTCDSFVVEAPYKHVDVKFEVSTWSKWSAKTDLGKVLLAKYPELAEIAKNAPMKQGGMLPLMVTPAAVDLTDGFQFRLQNANGSIANIGLSNPVKGANMTWGEEGTDKLVSRSAADDCLWSLSMEPAYDKKKYAAPHYASTSNKASLVAENEKGTVVRTAFAYTVAPIVISSDVTIVGNNDDAQTANVIESEAPYAESIDLLAGFYKNGVWKSAPVGFVNDYKNHYVIAVANALQAERYGLSIAEDGHTLNITKMPASDLSISVDLTVVALGLNGSATTETITLTIGQEIVVGEGLTPAEVTLAKKDQKVTWKYTDLGLSAVAFENFYKNNTISLTVTREADKLPVGDLDGEAEKYVAYNGDITFYNAKGGITTYTTGTGAWSNGAPETFGFTLKSAGNMSSANALTGYTAEGWTEDVYTVTLKSVTADGNTVVYAVGTELTVKNPELTADYVKLVSAFVEDDVFQITGLYSGDKIEYNLTEALITANGATVKSFVDYDNNQYEGDDEQEYAYYNWVNADETTTDDDNMLIVNKWVDEPEDYTPNWYAALNQQLYQTRNIRAMIALFNDDNLVPFDFQVIVKSEIYSEDASSVTADATKLKAKFADDLATTTVYENQIDLSKAITAKVVAGFDKDKNYVLFATKDVTTPGSSTTYDYSDYESMGSYVKGTDGNVITFSTANAFELQTLLNATNNANLNVDYTVEGNTYKLLSTDWEEILDQISGYVNENGNAAYLTDANGKVITVKYPKFKVNADNTVEFVLTADNKFDWQEGKVYAGNEAEYNIIKNLSGVCTSSVDAVKVHAVTVIPEDDETAGIYVNRWIALFNAYKGSVKCASTTTATDGTTTNGTPRDGRIVSVKIAFDNVAEASKFFTNTSDANGYVFTDAYAEDAILVAKETAAVDVTGGKVIIGMKAYIEDQWGLTMVVPFNVELATK